MVVAWANPSWTSIGVENTIRTKVNAQGPAPGKFVGNVAQHQGQIPWGRERRQVCPCALS